MISDLPDSLANSARKVILKGKYLTSVENYVSTLVISDFFLFKWNPEFEKLQIDIAGLHNGLLSKSNVTTIIFSLCIEFDAEHKDRPGPLSEPESSDLKTLLVDRIKSYIESLPRKYTLRISLPSFPDWDISTYEISKSVRLATGIKPPKNSLLGLLSNKPFIPSFETFIEFSAIGYSDWSTDSPTSSSCLSLAKQCAFILTTHGCCQRNHLQEKAKATLTDENAGITKEVNLPDSIARCFGQLIPNEKDLMVYENDSATILGGTSRPANTNDEKISSFKSILGHVVKFFKADVHPDFEGISTAIEWHQDSIFADNQSFSYIAACIGLEALFGSNNTLDNLSKRLADRYAFLLGKSRAEREAMITDYTDILNLRGRIVHSKAARLSERDIELLRKAQQMLLNAIWHELYAMYKTNGTKIEATS